MNRESIIRDTAYAIWEAEGRPEGRDRQHWQMAEQQVAASMANGKAAAKPARTPKTTRPGRAPRKS